MSPFTLAVVLLAGSTCVLGYGSQIPIEARPSLIQLEFKVMTLWSPQCLGTLITNYHFLTAASCVQDRTTNRRAIVGGPYSRVGDRREINTATSHPSYDPKTNVGDIAICSFNATVLFGPRIYPSMIMPQDYFIPEGVDANVVSLGGTTQGGQIPDMFIYEADVVLKNILTCYAKYPVASSNNICIGKRTAPGLDFDRGDTGAPAFMDNNIVAGILTVGTSRSGDAYPILATAVAAYSDWIVINAS